MNSSNIKNIGKNIILCGGMIVAGPPNNLGIVAMLLFSLTGLYILWTIFVSSLFGDIFYYFVSVLFSILIYNYLKCFLSDPGIIPRNHELYSDEKFNIKNDENYNVKRDCNLDLNNSENSLDDKHIQIETIEESSGHIHIDNSVGKNVNAPPSINNTLTLSKDEISQESLNKKIVLMFSNAIDDPFLFGPPKEKKNKNENSHFISGHSSSPISDKKIKENEYVPSIFKEKKCETCNILRPSATSHCRTCDNCIKNLDHHCLFVSNCIGERNQKAFIIFLITGSFTGILVIVSSFIHLFYVLFLEKHNFFIKMFTYYPIIMTLSLSSLFISFLFLWCRCRKFYLILTPFCGFLSSFIFTFYLTKDNLSLIQFQNRYSNPISALILSGSIPLSIFVAVNAKKQINLITRGLTTKQYESISKELILEGNKELTVKFNVYNKLKFSEKFKNIYKFFKKKQIASLIN